MENHHPTMPPSPPPNGLQVRESTARRPRGRPTGSKNKPKQPKVIHNDNPNSFKSHFLQIPPSHDIVQALSDYAVKRQRGICILSATGVVTNVAVRQPPQQISPALALPSGMLNFTGRFQIMSLSGAFLPPPAPPPASGMSVFLLGGEGKVMGGKVAGPLVTDGMVVISVASFAVTSYERLPVQLPAEKGDNVDEDKIRATTLIPQGQDQEIVRMNSAAATATAKLFHPTGAELCQRVPF